jgi:hypothetical protein
MKILNMAEILNNIRTSPTFRLFKGPNTFIGGISDVISTGNSLQEKYNQDLTENEADWNSLLSDWIAVGEDMGSALKKNGKEKPEK